MVRLTTTMGEADLLRQRATDAACVATRIAENTAGQKLDLAAWILERLPIRTGNRVLELCCGTGAQTLPLLEAVGPTGSVVALDVAPQALDTVRRRAQAAQLSHLQLV